MADAELELTSHITALSINLVIINIYLELHSYNQIRHSKLRSHKNNLEFYIQSYFHKIDIQNTLIGQPYKGFTWPNITYIIYYIVWKV